jgi:hypothetical protein
MEHGAPGTLTSPQPLAPQVVSHAPVHGQPAPAYQPNPGAPVYPQATVYPPSGPVPVEPVRHQG